MEYFINEVRETLEYNKKDTQRKAKILLNKWANDLKYIIDHIKPQLETERYKDSFGKYAMHLGLKKRVSDLKRYETEYQYIIDNIKTLSKLFVGA